MAGIDSEGGYTAGKLQEKTSHEITCIRELKDKHNFIPLSECESLKKQTCSTTDHVFKL